MLPPASVSYEEAKTYTRWACGLVVTYAPSPGNVGPAKTHRYPGGDQLQNELAGETAMIRNIIGKFTASAPVFRHDPHLKWRCAGRKTVPVHR